MKKLLSFCLPGPSNGSGLAPLVNFTQLAGFAPFAPLAEFAPLAGFGIRAFWRMNLLEIKIINFTDLTKSQVNRTITMGWQGRLSSSKQGWWT